MNGTEGEYKENGFVSSSAYIQIPTRQGYFPNWLDGEYLLSQLWLR